MRALVRAIRLVSRTPNGKYARTIELSPGLNVIRGENGVGKTQIIQAIIYALGLERMLTTRANAPLGSAFTSEVRIRSDNGQEAASAVIASWVAVELENANGQSLVAQRHIRHSTMGSDLVRVWTAPALTEEGNISDPSDYFLHASGSATHDRGFHRLLADFLGWQLPTVPTYSGRQIPLYVDVIFPFIVVDQQSWGSATPRKVERYQIRDPLRRSFEFLVALNGPIAQKRRAELEELMTDMRTTWAATKSAIEATVGVLGGRLVGVPVHPAGSTSRRGDVEETDISSAHIQLFREGEWRSADSVVETLQGELRALRSASQREVREDVSEARSRELRQLREELSEVTAAAHLIDQDLSMNEAQLTALDRRLDGLSEERDRNSDIRTLIRLGSQTAAQHIVDQNCPTCQQSLDGLESDQLGPTLSVDDTISLLNSQINTTKKMRDRARIAVEYSASAFAALQRQADQLKVRIRAVEADVLEPAAETSQADIASRITIELQLEEISRVQDKFAEGFFTLEELASRIALVRNEMNSLPEGMPESDARLIGEVSATMTRYLKDSRFRSYSSSQVHIDRDSLRPTREGFDIDIDVSASDVVRMKIAYLESVRSVGMTVGPHPGILILDEPRQQDIDPADFSTILRYLGAAVKDSGQIVITSATPKEELDALLHAAQATIIELGDQKLLRVDRAADALDAGA
ncbi:AAA family ATPase [Nonomuraea wenchangensis]